jgi:hypothetical protein
MKEYVWAVESWPRSPKRFWNGSVKNFQLIVWLVTTEFVEQPLYFFDEYGTTSL